MINNNKNNNKISKILTKIVIFLKEEVEMVNLKIKKSIKQ